MKGNLLKANQTGGGGLVAKSCPTLCNPMYCSLPGSSVHGILQARILDWIAIPSPEDLLNPEVKPGSPVLQADSLLSEPPGKPCKSKYSPSFSSFLSSSLHPSLPPFLSTFLSFCLLTSVSGRWLKARGPRPCSSLRCSSLSCFSS